MLYYPFRDTMRGWLASLRERFSGRHEVLEEDRSSVDQNDTGDGSNSRSLSTDYTELMGGSVPCPSCKGTGRIPKDMEEKLVALIPMTDDRLKPKRTWLYVLLVMAICSLIAGGGIFMLVPRAVDLSSNRPAITQIYVVDHTESPAKITFHFLNKFNISNYNYYNVEVINTTAVVRSKFQPWSNELIGSGYNNSAIVVTPLSRNKQEIYFNNSVTITDHPAEYCQAPLSKVTSLFINLSFEILVTLSYFNHRETVSISTIQQVCCVANCTNAS